MDDMSVNFNLERFGFVVNCIILIVELLGSIKKRSVGSSFSAVAD